MLSQSGLLACLLVRNLVANVVYDITRGTLRWFTAGVQSASLYDNFRKPENYVIMTS